MTDGSDSWAGTFQGLQFWIQAGSARDAKRRDDIAIIDTNSSIADSACLDFDDQRLDDRI